MAKPLTPSDELLAQTDALNEPDRKAALETARLALLVMLDSDQA